MDSCWMANCMSGLQGACESWSNRYHPVELLTRAPSLLIVYQDWLSVSSFVNRTDSKGVARGPYCSSPQNLCVSW